MELKEFFRAVYNVGTHYHMLQRSGKFKPFIAPSEFKDLMLLVWCRVPVSELVALIQDLINVGLVDAEFADIWDLGNEHWQREHVQHDPQWVELCVAIIAEAVFYKWNWGVEDTVAGIDHLMRLQDEHFIRCWTSSGMANPQEARQHAEQLLRYDIPQTTAPVLVQQLLTFYPEYGRKNVESSQLLLIEFLVSEYARTLD